MLCSKGASEVNAAAMQREREREREREKEGENRAVQRFGQRKRVCESIPHCHCYL